LLGIVIGWLVPRRAAWLSDRILTIAGIALTMFALALLIVNVKLHVGVAILVAGSLQEPRATALVAAYVVASGIATLIFMRLRSSTAQIPPPSGVRRP
jgi:hypothetical protein